MSCIEGFRRRFTLSDQMSILDTSLNLRDLLRVRDDDHHLHRNSLAGLTLGAVLGCEDIAINNGSEQPPRTPSRTLLDIIKGEESGTSYRGLNLEDNSSSNSNSKQQKSWKSFKDRLLLRKAAAAGITSSSSSNPIVVSYDDCGMVGEYSSSPNLALASSSSEPVVIMRLAAALAAEREEQRHQLVSSSSLTSADAQLQENSTSAATTSTVLQVTEEQDDQQVRPSNQTQTQTQIQNDNQRGVIVTTNDNQPLRVSLMALLEETVDYNIEEEGADDQDQVVVGDKVLSGKEKGGSGGGNKCCVCMIRPKGAAFIPCGHTFCRLCSRKLRVNRGNCPLCNSFILEILDIF